MSQHTRWRMLAVLFLARLAMAFQFQAVAALSSSYESAYGVGLDSIGWLIGLYLSPGILIALPSGMFGAWLGGRRGVMLGVGMMAAGAVWAYVAPSWDQQVAARTFAGSGGILLNVLTTKMVTDWFAGQNIATAMGFFVNSWPVGIALALLVLPWAAAEFGADAAFVLVVGVCSAALVVFAVFYRDPPNLEPAPIGSFLGRPGSLTPVIGVVAAGAIWGLYNAGLAAAFSFGAPLMVERGATLTAASAQTSLILWSLALTIPFGGMIADRTGRYQLVVLASLASFCAMMVAVALGAQGPLVMVILGVSAGLCPGPIMSLPSRVLPAHWRAQGMGLFFTLYYVAMAFAPALAGVAAENSGSVSAAFWVGAVLVALCAPAQWVVERSSLPRAP